MNRIPLRGLAVATATAVTAGGVALGLGAWTDAPAPTNSVAALTVQADAERAKRQAEITANRAAMRKAQITANRTAMRGAEITANRQAMAAAKRKAAAEAAAAKRKAAAEAAATKRKAAAKAAAARAEQHRASRSASRSGSPRDIARAMLSDRGWGGQFSCLNSLWQKESGWRTTAANPTSSAYGIPQALPGSKMASAGSDWRTNPATQIEWGLGYIADRYGSPCDAWAHSQSNGWY